MILLIPLEQKVVHSTSYNSSPYAQWTFGLNDALTASLWGDVISMRGGSKR